MGIMQSIQPKPKMVKIEPVEETKVETETVKKKPIMRIKVDNVKYNDPLLTTDLKGKLLQFVNAKVLRGQTLVDDHVWVRDGKILDASSVFFDEKVHADIKIDCEGLVMSPGFIDVQLNGGFGVDFSSERDANNTNLYKMRSTYVCLNLVRHGVTSFLPTIITSSRNVYSKVLPLLTKCNGGKDGGTGGAGIIGVHLEGPFLSRDKCGCHPPQHLKTFGGEDADVKRILDQTYGESIENVAMVTLAPEMTNTEKAIKYLKSKGIVVSLGHSSGGLQDGQRGIDAGATAITHLFNAMNSFHHRDPGLLGLLTSFDIPDGNPMYYGIIADGFHTYDSALRLAYRTCPEGMILVTDGISALGMPDGEHQLGEQTIVVQGIKATLKGTDIAAGSVSSMPYCIRHLVNAVGCGLEFALDAASRKPAALMKLPNKGVLSEGADADIVLLTNDVDIKATFIGGRLIHVN